MIGSLHVPTGFICYATTLQEWTKLNYFCFAQYIQRYTYVYIITVTFNPLKHTDNYMYRLL
jgi:hypothetical protein